MGEEQELLKEKENRWTPEQKDVIELRDRDILVSAAAGSGKTAVLVERILQKITDKENPCDIDELLVVTFTKAAAAEMRTRIGESLEKRLLSEPENEHIQKQMSLLYSAQISTIDSFCQSIVRNYFHVIHIDPVYRIADETELSLLKQEVLEELLEKKYHDAMEKHDTVFLECTEIFSTGRTDHDLEDIILNLYEKSTSMPWQEDWIRECGERYHFSNMEDLEKSIWIQRLMEYLHKNTASFLEKAKQAKKICEKENGPAPYLESIESDILFLEMLQKKSSYREWGNCFESFSPMKLKAVRGKEVDQELKQKVQALRESYLKKGILILKEKFFFQSVDEMLSDMQKMAPYVKKLSELVLDFYYAYSARKREENCVDFADVEHFALNILVTRDEEGIVRKSETALELQESYNEIMVDEYQDSNEVQELLLSSLCGEHGEKPTFFMVGDVKQSIYKFRMAEPGIFLEKYKRFTVGNGSEQRIDLHKNFRSRAVVLESANYFFEQLMREDFGGISYDEAARLVPGACFKETEHKTSLKTDCIFIERKNEDESIDKIDKIDLEAAVIGRKIREMTEGENPLYIFANGIYRPVEYRDIAILLRSMAGWSEHFIEVLNDMGIPAYAETKTGYFSTLEVEILLNYLHIIDNPRQDIPLVSVLRSCLFHITDDELAMIRTMTGGIDFWDKLIEYQKRNEDSVLGKKLSKFLNELGRYQEYAKIQSVYELLQKIYEETGYYHYMAAMPSGEKRKANLDILLEHSLEFAKYGHQGIYRFARYIENLKKADVDFGEASINSENTNAVPVMSIHKSKGLEFPVVFVAGMGKQFNFMDMRKQTLTDGKFGIGCDFVDLSSRVKQPTLFKNFIAAQMSLEMLEEEIRVLYVAFTRAKEKLFITGTASGLFDAIEKWTGLDSKVDYHLLGTAKKYLDWLMPALLNRDRLLGEVCHVLAERGDGGTIHNCFEDELFRMELLSAEEVISEEKEHLEMEIEESARLRDFDMDMIYDEEIENLLRQQESYRYPYEMEAELPVKISVSELKRRAEVLAQEMDVDGVTEKNVFEEKTEEVSKEKDLGVVTEIPQPKFLKEEEEISGASRGTLYHLAMEHFPYRRIRESKGAWGEREFDIYLSEMADMGYFSEKEQRSLDSRKFVRFLKSEIGQRMSAAEEKKKLHLEQPFMIGIPANEIYAEQSSDAMIMVQGIIDAFFTRTTEDSMEEIVLVDYKTDFVRRGHAEELVKKYKVQLEYYAKALERLTGKKVAEKVIYSFALGEEIRV